MDAEFRAEHRAYLKTKQWISLRNQLFAQRGRACEKCGCRTKLNVHHLTYARWKHELLTDLMILCRHRHAEKHKRNMGFKTVADPAKPVPIKKIPYAGGRMFWKSGGGNRWLDKSDDSRLRRKGMMTPRS